MKANNLYVNAPTSTRPLQDIVQGNVVVPCWTVDMNPLIFLVTLKEMTFQIWYR